jgi:ABC-2 type transport system permease protein
MYGTPIIYWINIPSLANYQHLLLVNPLAPIFIQTYSWMVNRSAPGALATAGGWLHLVPAMLIFVGICAIAVWKFNRDAPMIAEAL